MSQDSADLATYAPARRVERPARATSNVADRVFSGALLGSAWLILLVVFSLLAVLLYASWPSIKAVGFAALSTQWSPTDNQYGVLAFAYGTAVTSIIALALAGPMGVAVALFLSELAPRRVAGPVGMFVELLAAVPSVVYGLWGLFVLAPVMRTVVQPALGKWLGFLPLFQGPPLGIGMLTGGVLLAIMILPTVAAIARDVFSAVPYDQREGMLALGRAMGEAMAVVMVIGNTPAVSASLFRPAYTMASVLANEFTEATGQTYVSMLIELGLLLFGLSIVVNVVARTLVWSVSPKGARGR